MVGSGGVPLEEFLSWDLERAIQLEGGLDDSVNDSVNNTYQTIKANPGIQRKRISELTGKSIPTIDRHIALLAKASLIEHRDSDKTGGYYVRK